MTKYRCDNCHRKYTPNQLKDRFDNAKGKCPKCGSKILYKLRERKCRTVSAD